MRYFVLVPTAILLFAFAARAQTGDQNAQLTISPFDSSSVALPLASLGGYIPRTATDAVPAAFSGEFPVAPLGEIPISSSSPPAGALPQSPVYGTIEKYSTQVYGGYTFYRFRAGFGLTQNLNGFDVSLQQYLSPHFGLDGEYFAAFGQMSFPRNIFEFGGGGARLRLAAPRGSLFFVHGLLGYSHFVPQTPEGGQGAFGYEVGIGLDLSSRRSRWALRLQGDMLGTRFFGRNQLSPKFSTGIVYNF